jgi:transposase
MAKTQSQTGNITVKKEEEDNKPALGLMNVRNTRSSGRITKSKEPITNNRRLPAQQVKLEDDTDTKSLLKPTSNHSKSGKTQTISQEQINQLVHYITNDNMSVNKAARKVNMCRPSASSYYSLYKNDPEKRIPLPRNQTPTIYTQEQIGNLIRYINSDKMTVKEASAKTHMSYQSGHRYYNKYLKDPKHNIPIPRWKQRYTQDQINQLIDYIINDKMSIKAASRKAKINITPGRYYYKYFKQQNPDIATPSHIVTRKRYTQEQIKGLISYIVDDEMTIIAASKKVNINPSTARNFYQQYAKENNIEHPVTKKTYTQDQINELIGYIVDDKLNTTAASKKVNMSVVTGRRYYRQYLKDNNLAPIQKVITQEQQSELIGYIVDDKMSIKAASKKANISSTSGQKYYHRYLDAQKRSGPAQRPRAVSVFKNKE